MCVWILAAGKRKPGKAVSGVSICQGAVDQLDVERVIEYGLEDEKRGDRFGSGRPLEKESELTRFTESWNERRCGRGYIWCPC